MSKLKLAIDGIPTYMCTQGLVSYVVASAGLSILLISSAYKNMHFLLIALGLCNNVCGMSSVS